MPDLPSVQRGIGGRKSWLGALHAVAEVSACRFVDGVLETLVLRDSAAAEEVVDDPRLATVKQLVLASGSASSAVWNSARLVSLVRVAGPVAVLGRLAPRASPLERVRLLDPLDRESSGPPQPRFPSSHELLFSFGQQTAAGGPPALLSLTPGLVNIIEPLVMEAVAPGRHQSVGLEVPGASMEGVASWLSLAEAREEALFVIYSSNIVRLAPAQRLLRVGPMASGRIFELRLVLVLMLLRELPCRLEVVEIEGPHGIESQRQARKVLGAECRRRGDVKQLRIGTSVVAP